MKNLLTWKLPRWRDATTGMKLAYVFIITLNVINVTRTILEIRRDSQWEKANLVNEEDIETFSSGWDFVTDEDLLNIRDKVKARREGETS